IFSLGYSVCFAMRRWGYLPAFAVWLGLPFVYLLLPGHALALSRGLPLDDLGLVVAVALALLVWATGVSPQRIWRGAAPFLATCALLKLLLFAVALPYGLEASYTTSSDPGRPVE